MFFVRLCTFLLPFPFIFQGDRGEKGLIGEPGKPGKPVSDVRVRMHSHMCTCIMSACLSFSHVSRSALKTSLVCKAVTIFALPLQGQPGPPGHNGKHGPIGPKVSEAFHSTFHAQFVFLHW